MATMKPKITKLGDPANPYTKKKVTAAQARASARATGNDKPKPKASTPAPAKKKAKSEPTGALGRAWRAKTDKRIKDSGG